MAEKVEYIISLKDLFSPKLTKINEEVNHTESEIKDLKSTITGLAATFGGIFAFNQISDSAAKIETLNNTIKFASGSVSESARNFQFLEQTADKLKLPILELKEGFASFAGAARGTAIEGQATRDIFEGISLAARRLGLAPEQIQGATLALGQMVSKGKVQAEELRGQLGERIPGAFQIAARAMNMSTQELDKFMSEGKLMAEDFLPKFANQLKTEFGGEIPDSIQTFKNSISNLTTKFTQELIPAVTAVFKVFDKVFTWMWENKEVIYGVATAVGVLAGAWLAYTGYLKAVALWQTIVAATNPITLTIAGIAALAGVFVYAWNKFEGFRGAIIGFWEVAKNIFSNIWNIGKSIFGGLGKIISGIFTFDLSKIKEGLSTKIDYNILKGSGEAFKKGFEKGKELKVDNPLDALTSAKQNKTTGSLDAISKKTKKGLGTDVSNVAGSRPTNVTINIEKLIETVINNNNNIQEFRANLETEVKKVILTACNDFNIIAQ